MMMNDERFLNLLNDNKQIIDKRVKSYFNPQNKLEEAMLYASDGGKRIRAFLYLETKKMFSGKLDENDYKIALALEFIHAYSLVHDDLPAMDNDDYRRGKESVHKKFGEDMGILTGDALLNEACLILFDLANKKQVYSKVGSYILARSSKIGMIGGQVLDLKRASSYDLDYVLEVYKKKTSDLFKAACLSAAIVTEQNEETCKKIENFAENLGLAFQIQDDLLEDTYNNELNILNVMDKDKAIGLLEKINEIAKDSLKEISNNDSLSYLIKYLASRSY